MNGTNTIDKKVRDVRDLISVNFDSRQYFFAKAKPSMFDWLRDNGLLDVIVAAGKEETAERHPMPELDYLGRMAASVPDKVVSFIGGIDVPSLVRRPGVIDALVRVCGDLPAEHLARLAKKIGQENWVRLIGGTGYWGFVYAEMMSKLFGAGFAEEFLDIARVALTTKTREEAEAMRRGMSLDTPFLLSDLHHGKFFGQLAGIDQDYRERALGVVCSALSEAVVIEGRSADDEPFTVGDSFSMYDVDFFDLKVGTSGHLTGSDDVRELAAVAVELLSDAIGSACMVDRSEARRIYEAYVKPLPDSRAMYRLRAFVISACPTEFAEEIRRALFAVFEHEKFWGFVIGAEYERLLQKCFSALTEKQRREYVARALKLFSGDEGYLSTGHDIFSCIIAFLTEDELKAAEEKFGKLDSAHAPTPSIGEYAGGWITPRPPDDEALWGGPVHAIVEALKSSLSPDAIRKVAVGHEDFLRPISMEGVGDELRKRMEARPMEFVAASTEFFDRESISPHYTYSYLRAAHDLLRNDKIIGVNLAPLNALLEQIRNSGIARPFEDAPATRGSWSADWNSVHREMAEVLALLMKEVDGKPCLDFSTNRDSLLATVSYLLSDPDPTVAENDVGTSSFKRQEPGSREYVLGDPHTAAINSVRGEAFAALGTFAYLDGKRLAPTGTRIADDVKALYEKTLRAEGTQAVMFMFGRYFPNLYYRDRVWAMSLVPVIFSADPANKDLYLAAWEGYLTSAVYQELFAEPEMAKLYERAIAFPRGEYTKRSYAADLDEGLATHLALAFMHYPAAGFDSGLFRALWEGNHEERQAAFVGFLGGMFVSGKNHHEGDFLKNNPAAKERLREFWDWVLSREVKRGVLVKFGLWINDEKDVFDLVWLADRVRRTVEKTGGEVGWEYGLQKTCAKLANASPQDTLAILRLHLFDWGLGGGSRRFFFMRDGWLSALRSLYGNAATRAGTEALINDLIFKGGAPYWGLKSVLGKEA
jgi:hypothetical protein